MLQLREMLAEASYSSSKSWVCVLHITC